MIDKSKLYDLLYAKAEKLLEQYNPCNIRTEQGKPICNNSYMCETRGEDLCCNSCKYLSDNGCITNCLGCKLGMCWQGDSFDYTFNGYNNDRLHHISISQEFIQIMDRLRKIMHRYGLGRIQCSKKELFNLITV